jgi:hypothetical protein
MTTDDPDQAADRVIPAGEVPPLGATGPGSPVVADQAGTAAGEGGDGSASATITSLLPALAAVASLIALITTTLALVGGSDIPSLTRGAPWPTFLGASFMLIAVVSAGLAVVFPGAQRWLILGGYVGALLGLGLYLLAAVHVTSDPVAPQIIVEHVADKEETKVTTKISGMAFNERLHVSASFADEPGQPFARRVLGAGGDGTVTYDLVVPAQSRSRRLQVTAGVLQSRDIRRDFECNKEDAGRTCAEAATVLPRGMPEVRSTLREGLLEIVILDKRRIPGLFAVRVTRRGNEVFATRARVSKSVFRKAIRLSPAGRGKGGRDVVCIAAAYGSTPPACSSKDEAVSIVRFYPSRKQLSRGVRRT